MTGRCNPSMSRRTALRLMAVAAAAFFMMPWMWRQMGQYTVKLFSDFHPYVR